MDMVVLQLLTIGTAKRKENVRRTFLAKGRDGALAKNKKPR